MSLFDTERGKKKMNFTPIIDDFQISDVTYLDGRKEERPKKFAIEKYYNTEPTEVINAETGEKETKNRFRYVVGWLEWDSHESGFNFKSCGLRWLECEPTERAIKMICGFAEMMAYCIRAWEEEENG